MSLIGTLSDIKLGDVLQVFAAGRKSGLLTANGPEGQTVVRFQKGSIVYAAAGRLQGDEAVLDLFGWPDGQLTFVPEDKPVSPNVSIGVDVLIQEGVRMGERFHRANLLIPSDRVAFQLRADPPADARYAIGATEWRVLRILRDPFVVRDVLEASALPRSEVLRVLLELTEVGFLERVDVERALRVQPQGVFGRDSMAELDPHLEEEWKRIARFESGVLRIEVRTGGKKSVTLGTAFRPGLERGIRLPRSVVAEMALKDGEEVFVRPVA